MRSCPVSSGLLNCGPSRSNVLLRTRAVLLVILAAAFLTASTLPVAAQATKTASTPPPELSRFDLYGGYGYLHPVGSDIGNVEYQPINPGAIVSAAAYFNRFVGVQAEGSFFPSGPMTASSPHRPAPSSAIRKIVGSPSPTPSAAEQR